MGVRLRSLNGFSQGSSQGSGGEILSPTRKRGMPRNSIPIPTTMLIPKSRSAAAEGFVSYDKTEVNTRARIDPTNMAVLVSRRILANQRSNRPTLRSVYNRERVG